MLLIRPITAADNAQLADVIRNSLAEFGADKPGTVFFDPTTDDLFSLFQTADSAYFVAEDENVITGGAGVFPTPGLPEGWCELVKLYLSPAFRGRGLGKTLIRTCFAGALELGYKHIYLETMPELHNAISMYEREGFEFLDGPMGSSGHFGCDLWMKKNL